jgi:hypothetical protein
MTILIKQTWIVKSLIDFGQLIPGIKISKISQCTFPFLYHLSLEKGAALNLNLNHFHPKYIWAKFGPNWPSGSGVDVENVKSLQTDKATNRQTAIRKTHLSIELRWAKNWKCSLSPITSRKLSGNLNIAYYHRADVVPMLWLISLSNGYLSYNTVVSLYRIYSPISQYFGS